MKKDNIKYITLILDIFIIIFLIWTIVTGGLIEYVVIQNKYCDGFDNVSFIDFNELNISDNATIIINGKYYEKNK